MDNLERALRMEVATKQLEIDKLKRIIREKAKGTSKSSVSDK